MTHPEQTPKKPTAATGIFALLCALLGVGGTRASKISQGTNTPSSTSAVNLLQPHSTAGNLTDPRSSHALLRSLTLTPLLILAITLAALAFTTAPALAAGHEFSGEFNGGVGHEFSDPTGVAVNNATGNVYVVDKGNNRVEEFNYKGTFVAEFKGAGTAGELSEPEAIAIDNSGETAAAHPSVGDVYVTSHVEIAGESKGVVDKFSSTGAYLGQITEAEGKAFEPLEGVAVDPKGQVWVSQANAQIDAFSDAASNVFLSSRGPVELEELKPGLAVDSKDDLYVPNGNHGYIAQLNSMGEVLINPTVGESRGRTGVAVEPVSNDVYIDRGNPGSGAPKVQVYTPGGFTEGESPETFGEKQLADHGGTALAVSYANVSSGDVYVVDSSANKVDMFTPTKATGYFESFSFGSKGTDSGQFTEPLGVAVNDSTEIGDEQAGDVYVVDKGNKRVEQFNSTGTEVKAEFAPPGGFNEPEKIAVDNCKNGLGESCLKSEDESVGDVYVTDRRPHNDKLEAEIPYAVDKFSSTGTYLGQLRRCPEDEHSEGTLGSFTERECVPAGQPTEGFTLGVSGVAVDSEGNVWVQTEGPRDETFNEFSDTEPNAFLSYLNSPTSLGAAAHGLIVGSSALDPATGQLFVDRESSIDRYASGEESPTGLLETFPSTGGLQESQGIAVSPVGTVYATERTADDVKAFKEFPLAQVAVGALANLSPTSVTLQGSVNPEGEKVSSCEFEYGTTTSYGQTAACEPAAGSLGEGAEPKLVGAKVSGLPSGTTYHYRLVASDAVGTNPSSDHLFTTPGPSITAEQVTHVEAKAVTLNAQINPDGGATSYRFEYDTTPYGEGEAAHGTSLPVPSASIGSGTSPVSVSVKAQGLEAGTTYYYRAVAEGEPLGAPESFYGPNKIFTTNPAKGSAGGGVSESCPNEQRRVEQPYGLKLPDCRAYEMVSPVETVGFDATVTSAGQVRASEDKEQEAEGEAATPAITYASRGSFAEPHGSGIENQVLSRRNVEDGRWETRSITVPDEHDHNAEEQVGYVGVFFTPELTQGLTATAAAGLSSEAPEGLHELYLADLTDGPGPYQLVSQLPPSEEEYAKPYEIGPGVYPLGASSDLTHVVFATESPPNIGPLREWVAGHVVFVGVSNKDEVWTGAEVGNNPSLNKNVRLEQGSADVWRAVSEDGSRVIFNYSGELYARVNAEQPQSPMKELGQPSEECEDPADACTVKLSARAAQYVGASTDDSKIFYIENEDLYEYELPIGDVAGHPTDLTPGGKVQGVTQISEDGSYVYFVANGVLGDAAADGATPGNCGVNKHRESTGTACNLYVSHEGGTPAFIATLSAGDSSDWQEGPGGDSAVLAPGAPDVAGGARLAFTSGESLTGYDNRDAATGQPDTEVYLYDAETGALVCASCNPSGARPVGSASLATGQYSGLSSSGAPGASNYRPRDLLADGELFFDSSDALVPHASDGRQNVYEYEDGYVYAISNVAGGQESSFLDASADGQDVFFASADKLLPEDTGDNVAVWDARKDGGFPVNVSAPACTTAEACRAASPPVPGVFGAPPSATFSGPGNAPTPPPAVVKPKPLTRAQKLAAALKGCHKDKKKSKRIKCEKQARSKYGAAKKSSKSKRGGKS
jgi:DNA-binding beta-propeller fold protein YncE